MDNLQLGLLNNRAFAMIVAAIVIALCLICQSQSARAQAASASLSGTVVDQNGAAIPGAALMIVNPATGFTRETTTNESGRPPRPRSTIRITRSAPARTPGPETP